MITTRPATLTKPQRIESKRNLRPVHQRVTIGTSYNCATMNLYLSTDETCQALELDYRDTQSLVCNGMAAMAAMVQGKLESFGGGPMEYITTLNPGTPNAVRSAYRRREEAMAAVVEHMAAGHAISFHEERA